MDRAIRSRYWQRSIAMPKRMRRQGQASRSNGKCPRAGRLPLPPPCVTPVSPPRTNNGRIDISVVTFPGDGGDDPGNINRWRQQLGLPPADANASNIVPLKTNETTFSTIDIAGANTRTVAAWTRKDGRAWFFKLTGPSNGVEKEKTELREIRPVREILETIIYVAASHRQTKSGCFQRQSGSDLPINRNGDLENRRSLYFCAILLPHFSKANAE